MFALFAEKIDHFGRYSVLNPNQLCRGKIVRVDSKLVFKAEEPTRIIRISYQKKDRPKTEDFVSNKAVDPSRVYEDYTYLYYEDASGCLWHGKVTGKLENSYMFKTHRKEASKVHYYGDLGKVAHKYFTVKPSVLFDRRTCYLK